MLKTSVKFLFFATIVLNSHALPENIEELKQKYFGMIMDCAKEFPITEADTEKFKNKEMPDNDNAKCMFACAYKASGMMNDEGKLSIEGVNKISQAFLADDPDRLEKAKQFTEACKEVNDVEVSDGDKGCERAALIFKCTVEKAPKFDFGM